MIGDDRPHTIELLLDHKRLTLRVDGGQTRSIVNDGPQQYMRLNAPLYIGGLPREVGVNAYSQWHLRDISSFGGERLGRRGGRMGRRRMGLVAGELIGSCAMMRNEGRTIISFRIRNSVPLR